MSFCHCCSATAQDYVQIVWRFKFVATREICILSINCVMYKAAVPSMICAFLNCWYSGVVWGKRPTGTMVLLLYDTLVMSNLSSCCRATKSCL